MGVGMAEEMDQLRLRVARALKGTSVEAVANRMRAIVGPVPEGDAKRAIEKLEAGEIPSPQEKHALEVLIRLMRPAPLCKKGVVGELPEDNHGFEKWPTFQELVRPYLDCIGRIDAVAPENIGVADPPDAAIGTGFLVGKEMLLTNAHVLNILSNATFVLSPGQAVVRFKREYGGVPDEAPVRVESVIAYDRALDAALLRVASSAAGDGRKPLVFSEAPGPPA